MRALQPGANLVKICGIRTVAAAIAAAECGADLIGFVFAPVRRQIEPQVARQIIGQLDLHFGDERPAAVGLFVDAAPDVVNDIVAQAGLDFVQLHGEIGQSLLQEIETPVLLAMRTMPGSTAESMRREIDSLMSAAKPPVALLIDGYHPAQHGGMGARADWSIAAQLANDYPVILAGGLTPEIVGDAIDVMQPYGVDVSSGVETGGEKDAEKLCRFIKNARKAFAGNRAMPRS